MAVPAPDVSGASTCRLDGRRIAMCSTAMQATTKNACSASSLDAKMAEADIFAALGLGEMGVLNKSEENVCGRAGTLHQRLHVRADRLIVLGPDVLTSFQLPSASESGRMRMCTCTCTRTPNPTHQVTHSHAQQHVRNSESCTLSLPRSIPTSL